MKKDIYTKEKIIKNALYIGRNPDSEKNLVIIFDTEKNVKRLLKGYYSIPVDDYFLFGNIKRVAIMEIDKNTFIAEYYNSIGLVSRKLVRNCNSTEEAFRKICPDKEIQSVNRYYIDEEEI